MYMYEICVYLFKINLGTKKILKCILYNNLLYCYKVYIFLEFKTDLTKSTIMLSVHTVHLVQHLAHIFVSIIAIIFLGKDS